MRKSLVAVVVVATLVMAGGAQAQVWDLQLVSMTANVTDVKAGEPVTFTIVARNNGPDWGQTCAGGPTGHVSPDGTPCEFREVQPGETATATVQMVVNDSAPRGATNLACVGDGSGSPDGNPANDCMTKTLRIVGKRNQI